jgi:hypothetical protein
MLRHYLTIGGEDVSGFMQSVKLERSDSSARANFVIANIYGMFTSKISNYKKAQRPNSPKSHLDRIIN